MRVIIVANLGGVAGVHRWAQTREGDTPVKRAAMHLLTAEVNAAVTGVLDVTPEAEVIVWDGHGDGGIHFEELHPATKVILRGTGMGVVPQFDNSVDAVVLVGQHARAGTENAPLCYTFSPLTVEYYRLNGHLIGEIGCLAAVAGASGIPVLLVSGDDRACAEARSLLPNMETVETKQGLGIELALHLSVARARERIRQGVGQAMRRWLTGESCVLRIPPPYLLEIRLREGSRIDKYLRAGFTFLDGRTLVGQGNDLRALLL